MGVSEGDTLMMTLDDGMIRILTRQKAIQRVQESVRRYIPEGVSLADELIQERRAGLSRPGNDSRVGCIRASGGDER